MSKRFLFAVPVLAAILFTPTTASAEESITASPTTQRAEIPAGGRFSGQVKISNTGTTDFEFVLTADPYSVSGEDYSQSFVFMPGMTDASKWFNVRQARYSLKKGTEVGAPYEIKVPEDAGPGGYYAVLFAETIAPTGEGTVKSKKRVGIIFYLTVAGATKQSGSIESFKVPAIQIEPPLTADLRMRNDGNVHYDADTELRIKDIFGNTKAIIPQNKIILPGTVRRLNYKWEKAPGFGLFRVEGQVKYNGSTQQLPVRFTLMLSSTAFVVMFLLAAALIGYAIMTRKRRGHVRRH